MAVVTAVMMPPPMMAPPVDLGDGNGGLIGGGELAEDAARSRGGLGRAGSDEAGKGACNRGQRD